MTTPRDPDRLIHAFLLEGAEDLPDVMYDAVRADVERKRQRVVIGPWRFPPMNKLVPIGLGTAAVIAALLVGTQLLPRTPSVGGTGTPTPPASTTPSASPRPSSAAASSAAVADLPQGSYRLQDGHIEGTSQPGIPVTVTIPARGWFGEPNSGILQKNDADPPGGAGVIVFNDGHGWFVPSDPCQWTTTMPAKRSSTVAEQVAALAGQSSRSASAPSDITVDGHAGTAITLHTPADAVFNRCAGGKFCTLADPELSPGDACVRWGQGPGQIDNVWIVDVDGRMVIFDWSVYAGTPPADTAQLGAIVQSAVFK